MSVKFAEVGKELYVSESGKKREVKRGRRFIKGGDIELTEKLGRNDPCPCGSGHRFQGVLPDVRPL